MWKKGMKALMMTAGLCVAVLGLQLPVFAAGTVSVSTDKAEVSVEDKVVVTVQTSEPEDAATAPQVSINYDADLLNFENCNVEYGGGGGGLVTISGTSAQIEFTALKEGSAAISAEAIIDEDGNNPATGSATVSIGQGAAEQEAVAESASGSSDAALKALVVSPGTIIPAFDPDVTDYTIYVDEGVTDVKISGGVRDDNASITAASGFKNLQSGSNKAIVSVTAENGTVCTYNFNIEVGTEVPEGAAEAAEAEAAAKKEEAKSEEASEEEAQSNTEESVAATEAGSMEIDVEGITYMIQTTIADDKIPTGFTKNSFDYYGTTIEGATFSQGSMQLLYASSEIDDSAEFFIFDSSKDSLTLFAQIQGNNGNYIIPISAGKAIPSGFEEESFTWNDGSLPAYQLSKKTVEYADEFYLFYAVNQDGNEDFYLYDATAETYQRFLNYGAKASSGSGKMSQGGTILIGCLAIVLVGAILLIITLIIKNRELNNDIEILAQARERRKAEPSVKKAAPPKQVVVPDQAEEKAPSMDIANPEKPVAKVTSPKTVDPDVATEIPPMAQLAASSEPEVEKEAAKPVKKAVKKAEQKEVAQAAASATSQTAKKAVAKADNQAEKTYEEIMSNATKISGSTDDLSDVADLLDNEENMEFTKMLASFSTGRIQLPKSMMDPQALKAREAANAQVARQVEVPAQAAQEEDPVTPELAIDIAPELFEEEIVDGSEQANKIPVVNVEKKSVSLTREALPDEPDDDFEFEFINLEEH